MHVLTTLAKRVGPGGTKALIADPIRIIHRIYEYFDYDFDPKMEATMKYWLSTNPQHNYGIHRYSLEQFNISHETVNQLFRDYVKQFHIYPE